MPSTNGANPFWDADDDNDNDTDFYEEDEPVEKIVEAFKQGNPQIPGLDVHITTQGRMTKMDGLEDGSRNFASLDEGTLLRGDAT